MRVIRNCEPEVEVRCYSCKALLGVVRSDIRKAEACEKGECDQLFETKCVVCGTALALHPDTVSRLSI